MELAIALGCVGVVLVILGGIACFEWGVWKTRTAIFRIAEAKQREAIEALGSPPATGDDLLERLQDS